MERDALAAQSISGNLLGTRALTHVWEENPDYIASLKTTSGSPKARKKSSMQHLTFTRTLPKRADENLQGRTAQGQRKNAFKGT